MKRRKTSKSSAFTLLLSMGLIFSLTRPCYCTDLLKIKTSLRVSYNLPFEPPLLRADELSYYFPNDTFRVFPNTDILGSIVVENLTIDTVKLAIKDESFLKYLQLRIYTDVPRNQDIVAVNFIDTTGEILARGALPAWSKISNLTPGQYFKIEAIYPWTEIIKHNIEIYSLSWCLNNRNISTEDSTIYTISFESPPTIFKIAPLYSKSDSAFYFDIQSQNKNINEDFDIAITLCTRLIYLDPANLNAYRTAADVCWKMNRFEEGIIYARKGINILQDRLSKHDCLIYEHPDYYITVMQDFIEKCEKREKWIWSK